MHDKTIRNEQLAVHIGAVIGNVSAVEIGRVAQLAKADLVTDMVFEYPELQGTVGRIYAQHDGESAAVAQAIEEHYWPLSAEGVLPASALGTVLSLADKFDMLAGDFAAGIIPSGSQDPHGLRRMAVGILRMIKEKQLPLSIRQTVETAFSLLPASVQADNRAAGLLLDFFRQRLENMLESDGFRFDEIRAAVAVGWDDLKDLLSRLNAVQQMRSQADFVPLAAAFKRASNILKQAAKQQIAVPGQVHADGLQEAAEQELYAGIVRLEQQIAADIAGKDYGAALLKLVSMKPEVDRFFEKVMVMADDHALRANRLALLNYASTLFSRVADLSQLQA